MNIQIPEYKFLNMMLTGGACVFFGILTFGIDFINLSKLIPMPFFAENSVAFYTLVCIVIYEIGLIINRIGSLLIENILIGIKVMPHSDYRRFNEAKSQFPILDVLSREYAASRTQLTLFLILSILSFIAKECMFLIIYALLSLLFFCSMIKFSIKINQLAGK